MTSVRIDYENGTFLIRSPINLAAIGDWVGWQRRQGQGHVFSSRAWTSAALSVKPPANVTVTWSEQAEQQRQALLQRLALARRFLSGGQLPPIVCPTERKPKGYQHQAVCAMRAMDWRVLLGDDMGLGKTSTSLWSVEDSRSTRLLVVCPVSAKFNWQRELITTLGDRWEGVVVDGDANERKHIFSQAKTYVLAKNVAIIINYDLLRLLSDEQKVWLQWFVKNEFVIFDECHYLLSQSSIRSALSAELSAPARCVVGLSGTAVRNKIDNLFQQVEIIRPNTWSSYRDFAKRHLIIKNIKFGKRGKPMIVGTRNLEGLNAVMNTLQIRRMKTDVLLDLPPKIHTYPDLELADEHLAFYKAMKDFARLELAKLMEQDKVMTVFDPRARSGIEQAMRCEQIAQGFVGGIPDPVMAKLNPSILRVAEKIEGRPNELIFPTSPKLAWLLEFIDTILGQGQAPAVASRFNAPMFWIEKHLAAKNIKARIIHGGLDAKQKDTAVLDFHDRVFDVLLFQVKIAEVWNATRCRDVMFLGRDWSPAINSQAEDRFYRMGQKGTVNVQIPIVRKTVEVMLDRKLRAKSADAAMAMRTVTVEELMEAL